MKIFASTKPLNFEAMQKSKDPAATLYQEMRKAYPAAGKADFISTDGWAAETVWLDFD